MKLFIKKITLFFCLFFLSIFFLCAIDFEDDFLIYKTKDTAYEKVSWNLNVISQKQNYIKESLIFFGPSLVQGGINDSLLTKSGVKSLNMGIPHNGNEISLYFLERILDLKPKGVVFLKPKTSIKKLHKLTPLFYTPTKLIVSGQSFNSFYIEYLFKRTKLVFEYFGYLITKDKTIESSFDLLTHPRYGIINTNVEIDNSAFVNGKKDQSGKTDEYYNFYLNNYIYSGEEKGLVTDLNALVRKLKIEYYAETDFGFNVGSQNTFLANAISLCEQNILTVSSIYIPELIDVVDHYGYNRSFYKLNKEKSSIEIMDFKSYSFLDSPALWSDVNHLNTKGSEKFTQKIIQSYF